MATIMALLGLVFLAVIGSSGLSFGSFLRKQGFRRGYESALKGWLGSLYNSPAREELLGAKPGKVCRSLISVTQAKKL